MSRNKKIVLLVVSSVLLSCACVCLAGALLVPRFVSDTVSQLGTPENRAAQAKRVGAQIAGYVLPPGYAEELGMDLYVEKIVMLGPTNQHGPAIMMLQMNVPTASREQMEEQMRQAFANQYPAGGIYEPAGEHAVTIKGQPVTLTVSESNAGGNDAYAMRQAQGVFQGKGGIVMVMVTGQTRDWDWKVLDAFFASIR